MTESGNGDLVDQMVVQTMVANHAGTKNKWTEYRIETLETSLIKGVVKPKKLESAINDVTMSKDGWKLAWMFIYEKRKFLLFKKKTVFMIFHREVG